MRTEVIDEAVPFLAIIPADRVRAEPLPGDTIRIHPIVADHDGIVEPATLAPHWLLCPTDQNACISTLEGSGDPRPCTGWPEPLTACSLGASTDLELTIPDFDPDLDITAQLGLQIAFIAGDPAITDTAGCIHKITHEEDLRGCMLAYTFVRIGPLAPMLALADQAGIPVLDMITEPIPLDGAAQQPNFNPEIEEFVLYGGGKEYIARAGETTTLPPHTVFGWEMPGDQRDWQKYAEVSELGVVPLQEQLDWATFFTEAELRDTYREVLDTGSVESFTLFVVLSDRRGGQGVGQFDFVVSESAP